VNIQNLAAVLVFSFPAVLCHFIFSPTFIILSLSLYVKHAECHRVEWVALLLYILEVLDLSLGPETSYPDRFSSGP
jgi:hypothetical protein